MPTTLACPTCSAPLDPPRGSPSVMCTFCGNNHLLGHRTQALLNPERHEPRAQPIINVHVPRRSATHPNSYGLIGWVYTAFAALCVALPLILYALGTTSVPETVRGAADAIVESAASGEGSGIVSGATVVETIGQGVLDDARWFALAADGSVTAVEQGTNTVIRFAADGEIIEQFDAGGDGTSVAAVAVTSDGDVLVNQGFDITRFDASGAELGDITVPGAGPVSVLGPMAVLPDDRLAVVDRGASSQLHILDDTLQIRSSGPIDSGIVYQIGAGADGTIAVLRAHTGGGGIDDVVDVFDADGAFMRRLFLSADGGVTLRGVSAVAVAEDGRIAVSDLSGVRVVDAAGRETNRVRLRPGQTAYGLAFDGDGLLWMSVGEQLLQVELPT